MPDEATATHPGGCFCGAVRYVATGAPLNVRICHCQMCRKLTSSAFFARAMFPSEAVTMSGPVARFHSSEDLERLFCPACSTLVGVQRVSRPDLFGITLGSLDDPNALAPECHVWTSAKVDWLVLDDGLPQYLEGAP